MHLGHIPRLVAGVLLAWLLQYAAAASAARIDVCGDITANATWLASNVYVVNECALRVAPGATLSVQPGTVVKFAGARSVLLIQGTLAAAGTSIAPVVFTAYADDTRGGDTNGDGPSAGAAGSWGGIRFDAGSQGSVANAFLGFGGSGQYDYALRYNEAILESVSSAVTVDRVEVRGSGKHGVYAFGASPPVSHSQFADNAQFGLFYQGVDPAVALSIEDNQFSGSGAQAGRVALAGAGQVTVRDNGADGARNGFRVDGTLAAGSLLWDNEDNLPLVVDGALTVETGATVTLGNGTIAKFAGPRSVLRVLGSALLQGTGGAPIALTSIEDDAVGGDTNGDGPSSGAPGQWAGVRFERGAHGSLGHAHFSFGASGQYDNVLRYNVAMLESFGSDVSVDHCEFRGGLLDGAYAENASIGVADSLFADNGRYGLRYDGVDPAVPVVVRDSAFEGNGGQAGSLHVADSGTDMTFSGNRGTGPRNGFRIEGSLTAGNLTWDNRDELPLLVDGGFAVGTGVTLALEEGSVVKFADARDVIVVRGSLIADGVAAAEVVFTAIADDAHGGDTNGDGPSSAAPGQWGGLRFAAGSTGRLRHVVAAYGGSGEYDHSLAYNRAIVESYSSDVTLDYVVLRDSGLHGLFAAGASVAVSHSTMIGNAQFGLYFEGVDPLVGLVVTDNTFAGPGAGAARMLLNGNPSSLVFARNEGTGDDGFRGGFSLAGAITADATWENSASLPLVVDGGLSVAQGATLSVSPGTVVKFAGPRDVVHVLGGLIADGTEDAPIAFTSLSDDARGGDTNGDGASTGSRGQWAGLRFVAGSAGLLRHAFVGYGGSGQYDYALMYNRALVDSVSSDVALERVVLRSGGNCGLYAAGASVSVSGSAMSDNAQYGLYYDGVAAGVPLAVRDNTFADNGLYGAGLHLRDTSARIDLEDNTALGGRNAFRLDGRLAGDSLRWSGTQQAIVVDGGLVVAPSTLLQLAEGTTVKFAGPRDVIAVEGEVQALGSFASPIAFTSIADDSRGGDTNGDGASAGQAGQWGSLRFAAGSRVRIEHASVRYAGSGQYDHTLRYGRAAAEDFGGTVDLRHVALQDSGLHGLYAENAHTHLVFARIERNALDGVFDATPQALVDARRSWWGDASGPHHATQNPGGEGAEITLGVLFDPWLRNFAWLDPESSFLHGVERLSWGAFGVDATGLEVDVAASDAEHVLALGAGLAADGELEWDTRAVADGVYELRATFRGASGVAGEVVRSVVVNNSSALEWHAGWITADETWSAARVHLVVGDVFIAAGVRVAVEPGAVVKLAPGAHIYVEVEGELDGRGAAGAPVVFTSTSDDGVGGDVDLDGGARAPQPGDWAGFGGGGDVRTDEFTDVRYAQSEHGGALAASETWLGTMVHRITSDLVVPNGVTLTIDAGAVVKLEAGRGITVQAGGQLRGEGGVAEPIVFTSARDDSAGGDSNGDGSQTAAGAGDWRWIFLDGGQAALDHVEIRYGGGTPSGSWDTTGALRTSGNAVLEVSHSIVRDSFFEAILAWGGGDVTLRDSVISGADRGINSDGAAIVRAVNTTIDGARIGVWGHGGRLELLNTIVSNSSEAGIDNVLSSPLTMRYCDVWSATGSNYVRTQDRTGSDGNISADPRYVDRARGDLRLDYRSPAIDAADGAAASAADFLGAPRYDDPRSPNTGTPTSGGAFADIGAWEFVESAPSPIDLVVTGVSGPTTALAGETARIAWNVNNDGTAEASGPWHDTINLVYNPGAGEQVVFAAEVLVGQNERLGPGQSLAVSAEIRVPGSIVGQHRWQVVANTRGEVFEGANRANNATLSAPVMVDLPELSIGGAPLGRRFASAGEAHWFKLQPAAAADVLVSLDRAGTGGVTELYLGRGYVPERQSFDARQHETASPDATVLVAGASAQTYYVLAYPASLPAGGANFSIGAAVVPFSIDSVGPTEVGNAGAVTLAIRGGKLREGLVFEIVDALGGIHAATSVFVVDSSLAYATFDLGGLPVGGYRVRISDGPQTVDAPATISVVSGRAGKVRASLVMPEVLRPDWTGMVTVEYANEGGTDVVAPILVVDVSNGRLRLEGQPEFGGSTAQVLGIQSQGPAGILPPGGRGTATLEVKPTGAVDLQGRLWILSDPDAPMNWSEIRDSLRPEFVPETAWDAIFANFAAEVGTTVGQYQRVLADDATHLSRLGEYTHDVRRLLAFELNQAGLGTLSQRDADGTLGRGATTSWETAVVEEEDGGIAIGAGGAWRFFRPQADGSYRGVRGETGILARDGDGFRLEEQGGGVSAFGGEGRLAYVEDANGNRISAVYDQGRLSELRDSNGDVMSFTYGAHGHAAQIVDAVGRTSVFTYDGSSEYLVAADTPDGHMAFDYGPPQNGVRAVTRLTYPDASAIALDYDAQGRLALLGGGDGTATSTMLYGSTGGLTTTDATGAAQTVLVDDDGNPASVDDGSAVVRVHYDAQSRPVRFATAGGAADSLAYDAEGNLTGVIEASGARLAFGHQPALHQLTSFTNALGRTIGFERDAAGNLVLTTYPDGGEERFEYTAEGRLAAWVNAREQRATFEHDAGGAIVRHELPEGSVRTFGYGAHRNLVAATDARGTTALEYDDGDHLVRITYPSGRWVEFTYDAGGRRARRLDQDGFAVNYAYDALGRLARLTNGDDDLIVEYAYDEAGRPASRKVGNGVVTRYEYDFAGRLHAVDNRRTDDSVLSRFEYAYDREGHRTGVSTPDGSWSFTYDAAKRLARALFASRNAAVPSRDLAYEYDAAGNRVRTVAGGVGVEWTANAADQYLAAGGARFEYDRDGNLVRRHEGGLEWEYRYDSEGRLTFASGPGGTSTFEYDVFGQRSALVQDGVRTEYDVDPMLGDVLAIREEGAPVAHLVHGNGLVSRVGAESAYYSFDAVGSTSELTDANGEVLDRYAYLPFGEPITLAKAVDDPFLFVGELGVLREPGGLYHMSARHFDPGLGRFLQRDPISIDGGSNLYAYAGNDPVDGVDPSGQTLPQTVLVQYLKDAMIQVYGNPQTIEAIAKITGQNLGKLGGYVGTLPQAQKLKIVEIFTRRVAAREAQLYAEDRVAKAAARGFGRTFIRGTMQQAGRTAVRSTVTATTQTAVAATGGGAGGAGIVAVLTTPVSALGAGTIAAGVVVAGALGVAVGTGLRYIPGVDEGAQSVWIKLDDWTGGWIFGTAPADEEDTDVVSSHDPNDILGPAGYGAARWVSSDVVLGYTIRFENDKSADAPAQVVRVVQQLDPDLDLTTFELGSFGFGDLVVHVPPGRTFHSERIDLTATRGVYVDVTAELDLQTGIVTWELRSIDPVTGLAPRDPFAGFLPPNVTSPMGQGFVSYTVRARSSVAGGQWIDAKARITFDTNEPIDTPVHVNTLDADAPSSQVEPLPEVSYSPSIRVRWHGSDGGAGVATVDLYAAVDGGSFDLWLAGVAGTTAVYSGQYGHRYAFYSIANDHTGHAEAAPPVADATTLVEPLPGDANCDGALTAADLVRIQQIIAGGGPDACPGDADGDLDVDADDLAIVLVELFGE